MSPPLTGGNKQSAVHAIDENALYRTVTVHLIPFLFLCYLAAFLDRINVGYAKLQMSEDLGFSAAAYGVGAGLFFLTYLVFEVPSNIVLERIGARLTLLRIMALWGIVSTASAFVQNPTQFYIARLLLGACEAGFFPGIILFLTYWFPEARRGRVTGLFMLAIPVAGVVGGPLSGAIMAGLDGVLGFRGWQWMLICEGLPSVFLGLLAYLLLADRPADASWLTLSEKQYLQARLDAERSETSQQGHPTRAKLAVALVDRRVWLLALIYFATACANYTFTFWLPTIIESLGVPNVALVGLYSAVPYIGAVAGILIVCGSSDRYRERRWHIGGAMMMGALGLASTPFLGWSLLATLAALTFTGFFQFAAGIAYWTIPATYLDRHTAAVGIGVISSIGATGGFVSPSMLGLFQDLTGTLTHGILAIACISAIGAILVLTVLPKSALNVRAAASM